MAATRELTLAKIEEYLVRTGMGHTYFGQCAGVGASLVDRLRAGKDIETETRDKIFAFMSANPNGRKKARRGERAEQHTSQ